MRWAVREVVVRFDQTLALDRVTLELEPGRIHGVIGGDGAGKSTLLRVFAGLDIGQLGDIRLPASERIGFVPSHGGIFGDLTVAENIEFIADVYGLRDWRRRAEQLLDRAALGAFGARVAGRMSGGQRRKLAGCMALLPEPDLLVLDEVTTGVDPVSRMEIWRLVADAAASGAAVVAATTYLDEAERMERILLLHEGRSLASGTAADIIGSIPGVVHELDTPTRRDDAWRVGRRWRQWSPTPTTGRQVGRPTLEDAAIVLELGAERLALHPPRTEATHS